MCGCFRTLSTKKLAEHGTSVDDLLGFINTLLELPRKNEEGRVGYMRAVL